MGEDPSLPAVILGPMFLKPGCVIWREERPGARRHSKPHSSLAGAPVNQEEEKLEGA